MLKPCDCVGDGCCESMLPYWTGVYCRKNDPRQQVERDPEHPISTNLKDPLVIKPMDCFPIGDSRMTREDYAAMVLSAMGSDLQFLLTDFRRGHDDIHRKAHDIAVVCFIVADAMVDWAQSRKSTDFVERSNHD